MYDNKKIAQLTADALASISTKDAGAISAAYKLLDDTFLTEFPGQSYAITGDALLVRMRMIAAFVEYNIYSSNIEGIRDNLTDLAHLAEFAKHQSYSGELNSNIRWCVKNANKRFEDLLNEHLHPDPALYDTDYIDGTPVDDNPQRVKPKTDAPASCLLCRQRNDFRKGSHLAPNTLIQQFFSIDGSSTRGKEIAKEHIAAELKERKFWGSAVQPEEIDETFGEVIPDSEKIEIKPNPLTRDDVFCDFCEKRFGYIEGAYGEYLHGRKKTVNPVISYLFWVSVFWRLSIADMCVRLSEADEEQMRLILDRNLPDTPKGLTDLKSNDSLRGFKYCLYHCDDIKGEVTGLIGNHASRAPYRLIAGNYVIVMYPESYNDGTQRDYNSFIGNEVTKEESFLDFWKHKRSILDEVNGIESNDLNDESSNISDVVKGENAWEIKILVGNSLDKITLDEVKQKGEMATVTHPGAIARMLAWTKQHRHLSIEEQCEGIKKDLGYTYEESDYLYKWFWTHYGAGKIKSRN